MQLYYRKSFCRTQKHTGTVVFSQRSWFSNCSVFSTERPTFRIQEPHEGEWNFM